MTETLDSFPPPTTDPVTASPAPATGPTAPLGPDRRRSGWHVLAIVAGALSLLPALGVLAGGTTLAVAQAAATDDGYFTYTPDRLRSDGVAVITDDAWLDEADDGGPWVLDWLDLDVRIRAEAIGDEDVFVGIAPAADVDEYLDGAAHSVIDELDGRRVGYIQVDGGTEAVVAPDELDIWVASASGPGEQQLDWEARGGHWTVVVMHADATPDVAADVQLGLHSGAVTPIAVTLIVFGGIGVLVSIGLLVIGIRGRRTR